MKILAIDTSCDETSVAVVNGRRILSNVIYSQIVIHKKWGGVVPYLAKRAHEERIDMVVEEALKKVPAGPATPSSPSFAKATEGQSKSGLPREVLRSGGVSPAQFLEAKFKGIDYIAVTYGPGLAPALEVGIKKAKELARKYSKKIIPVNHMEGHIYSVFAQNSMGNPTQSFEFPYLALLVSGGHTEIVIFKDHNKYEVIGETLDDAAGEALDKAAKMLGLGYPGGPVIEALAKKGDLSFHHFPRPYLHVDNLNFSFSGLKTSFLYFLKRSTEDEINKNISHLAATFQDAVFSTLLFKLNKAILQTGINRVIAGGGVMANAELRRRLRLLMKKHNGSVLFPTYKTLYGDNAAMIGIAASFKKETAININEANFERVPRAGLGEAVTLQPIQHQ